MGTNEISNLGSGLTRNAVDERSDPGKAEIQMGSGQCRLCGNDRGLSAFDGSFSRGQHCFLRRLLLLFGVELALRNGPGLGERRIAVHVDARQFELSLGLLQLALRLRDLSLGLLDLALRLIDGCLERARIDFKQHLTLLDNRAFAVGLPDHVAAYLGLNLSVNEAVECSDPLAGERHVCFLNFDDGHRHGPALTAWASGCAFLFSASATREPCARERQQSGSYNHVTPLH